MFYQLIRSKIFYYRYLSRCHQPFLPQSLLPNAKTLLSRHYTSTTKQIIDNALTNVSNQLSDTTHQKSFAIIKEICLLLETLNSEHKEELRSLNDKHVIDLLSVTSKYMEDFRSMDKKHFEELNNIKEEHDNIKKKA